MSGSIGGGTHFVLNVMVKRFAGAAIVAGALALPATVPAVAAAQSGGLPQQNVLPVWPDNPNDASIGIGVIPYDEIAPKLNSLQAQSDRVSARVGGKSSGGRDLYVVTVTWPESPAEYAQQEAWKRQLQDDPVAARQNEQLLQNFKPTLFVNGSIHGNEYEGVDASLRVIEELATSNDPAVEQLLRKTRFVFNVTANPDGRVAGVRPNDAGYDVNREMATISQPESRLIREVIVETQPMWVVDLHGYVNRTLIEPTTPPHNANYEYDLYIKHALPGAIAMEDVIKQLPYSEVQNGVVIPFRDYPNGEWDDWPPIYVPMWAMFHGAIGQTIEAPLNPRGNLNATERARRVAANIDVHSAVIRTAAKYMLDNRNQMLQDYAEFFRRGLAGEPSVSIPDGYVPGWGPEDNYSTTYPRSYVIPVGPGQHSAPAAKRLVDMLIGSDVRVVKALAPFTAGGKSYAAGSYIVDMHQGKRGMANTMLEAGMDITDRVSDLYAAPAGWSHGYTWGATVDALMDEMPAVATERVFAGEAPGEVANSLDLVLDPQDGADLVSINALLNAGVKLYRLEDGRVIVPGSARALAQEQASANGSEFKPAPSSWTGGELDKIVVAYNGGSEVRDTLAAMGFEARPVTATTLTTVLTDDVDVLLVGGTLNPTSLNSANRAALDAFLARGGGIVGSGTAGAQFVNNAGLLTVTSTAAGGIASGVANVVNHGGPISNGAMPYSFILQPVWYSNIGANGIVEQTYAADPLLAGWWPRTGNTGRNNAAGKASIVRTTTAAGNGVALIGTSVFARLHGKGLYSQLGRAILFADEPITDDVAFSSTSADGTVGGSVAATLSLSLSGPVSFGAFIPGVEQLYTASTTATVISTAGDATLTVTDPSTNAPGHLVNGAFSLAQPLRVNGAVLPATAKTYDGPVSNDAAAIEFTQAIGSTEPLRTGTYSKTLTFTLSTTNP
jgi:hypothetical protein